MSEKLYGVFHFCFHSVNTDAKREILYHVWEAFISPAQESLKQWSVTSRSGVYNDKERAQQAAWGLRQSYKHSRKNEYCVYHVYKDRVVVHECDRNGVWIPTKKELKEAQEYADIKWGKKAPEEPKAESNPLALAM